MELSIGLELAVLLFACAIGIGCLDAISGAGGLLTVPLVLALGFPPIQALATNKLQGVFGTGSSTLAFARAGTIDARAMRPAALSAAIGAALGTLTVEQIDSDILRRLIPLALIAVALYFLFSPRLGDADQPARIPIALFAPTAAGGIAFYDGLLGLGTGGFLVASTASLLGQNLRTATAHAKLLNFTSNVGSFAFFALGGNVVWTAGFAMAAGQVIGARLGARVVLAKGAKVVRPLVVLAALGMAVRLLVAG